jgi:hypothetical protein
MLTKQGDLALLNDPIAQELLRSTMPAKLAYVWHDGTPRVVPFWFHWTGEDVVLGTPPNAPKLRAPLQDSRVALTIDGTSWPYKVLLIRGAATVSTLAGVSPEYAAAARRYLGEEAGRAWMEQVGTSSSHMVRIAIWPEWVGILDFQTRFPSAMAAAMAGS